LLALSGIYDLIQKRPQPREVLDVPCEGSRVRRMTETGCRMTQPRQYLTHAEPLMCGRSRAVEQNAVQIGHQAYTSILSRSIHLRERGVSIHAVDDLWNRNGRIHPRQMKQELDLQIDLLRILRRIGDLQHVTPLIGSIDAKGVILLGRQR